MTDVETPLHPSARSIKHRLISERALALQYSMIALQKPLSLITLTGV